MPKHIAILQNPYAGKNRPQDITRQIISELEFSGYDYSLFCDNWPQDYSHFSEIWLVGGDGTLNYFVNHFQFNNLPLALFKGGTGNDFAWKLYGDIHTREQIRLVLQATPKPVDAGICNGHYFLNTVGIGFDGKVLGWMNTIRFLGSRFGYYLAVLGTIFTYREPFFRISAPGFFSKSERLLLCAVSNAPRTGGGFLLSPKADPTDGWLNLICCRPLGTLNRLRFLSRVKHGRHINLPVIDHQLVTQVKIDTNIPLPAQLDGELILANSFEISVVCKKFQFLF